MTHSPTNALRNAEIIRRRKAGEWPSEISRSMGLGRNTVIGVCYRAGLADASNRRGWGSKPEFKALVVEHLKTHTWTQTAADWGVSGDSISRWKREIGDAA